MQSSPSPITKTYDPFPKLTEYKETKFPSPKSSPSKSKDDKPDIMSSPVIREYNKDGIPIPKPISLTEKIDEMINIIDGEIYKESGNKPVLVEWKPQNEKVVNTKDKNDKIFVKWSKDQKKDEKNEQNEEDLQNLEKDYLNLNKLQNQVENRDDKQ